MRAAQEEAVLPRTAMTRVRVAGVVAMLLIGIGLWATQDSDGGPFARIVFDLYQQAGPRDQPDDNPVIIVSIDETSLAEIGAWPWPRHYLGDLVEIITLGGARAIGFDMVFPEPDRYGGARLSEVYRNLIPELADTLATLPEPDDHFARHLARAPSVLARSGADTLEKGVHDPATLAIDIDFIGPTEGLRHFPGVTANIPLLDGSAAGHGVINGTPDPDGVIRRVHLMTVVGEEPTPGFALELTRIAMDEYEIHRSENRREIRIGDHVIPTDSNGHMRLHFAPTADRGAVSASAVLDGTAPPQMFQDRIVIIAPGALGLEDVITTPLEREVFGVDIHAQAIESILEESWLIRPVWGLTAEWALFVVLSLGSIVAISFYRFQVLISAIIATTSLTILGAWLVFQLGRLLLDPTLPLIGLIGIGSVMIVVLNLEREKHQRSLQAALTEVRVEQARVAGELNAARDIQLGILPDAKAIPSLPDQIDVAAFLAPAREIGGDLYDIFMLDDRHLYFLVGDVTGKGVPAALFMSISKVLTKSAVTRYSLELEEAVLAANNDIGRDNPADLFVTALAGILDCGSGTLTLVNAGHDDPIILSQTTGETRVLACNGGPPLCVMEDFPYEAEQFTLAPDETMVIITDGVTEARAPNGDLFGMPRLLSHLETVSGRTADTVIQSLVTAVRGFEDGEPPTDDLTVLAIRQKPE